MKNYSILFLLLFFSLTAFCQHPYKQNLKGVATIVLPDTPTVSSTIHGVTYSVRNNGDVFVTHISEIARSPRDLFTRDITDSVYRGVEKGITQIGAIFYKKYATISGLRGITLAYKRINDSVTEYCYLESLYFNNDLIINSYKSRDSLRTDDKKITSFFNTFKLTILPAAAKQSYLVDTMSNPAYIFKAVLIAGLILILGIFVIYGISRLTNKKTNE